MRLIFSFFVLVQAGFAQNALDWSFNSNGVLIDGSGLNDAAGYSMTLQSDGKILVAGNTFNASDQDLFVARYNDDGSPDLSFDGDGKRIIAFAGVNDSCSSLLLQSDGKILLGGHTEVAGMKQGIVIRLLSNGDLDTTFNGNGIHILSFVSDTSSDIRSLALQSDGMIVAGGSCNDRFMVLRFDTNGDRDMSFVPGSFSSGPSDLFINDIAIQPDGKIIAAGVLCYTSSTIPDYCVLARYNTDGSLDGPSPVFFKYGTTLEISKAQTLCLQPDGNILVGGAGQKLWPIPLNSAISLARFNTDLSLDTLFSSNGIVYLYDPSEVSAEVHDLQYQIDGKIIALAYSNIDINGDIMLVRFNDDGSVDSSFGVSGKIVTDLGNNEIPYTSCLYPDLRIGVAGTIGTTSGNDLMIARYNANGVVVDEIENQSSFNVYPNPVSDQLTISSKTAFNNASLKLMDVSGKIVFTQQNIIGNNFILDVSIQTSGLYVVEITEEEAVSRIKLMKL